MVTEIGPLNFFLLVSYVLNLFLYHLIVLVNSVPLNFSTWRGSGETNVGAASVARNDAASEIMQQCEQGPTHSTLLLLDIRVAAGSYC